MESDLNSLTHQEYTQLKYVPMMRKNPLRMSFINTEEVSVEKAVFKIIPGTTKYIFSHLAR